MFSTPQNEFNSLQSQGAQNEDNILDVIILFPELIQNVKTTESRREDPQHYNNQQNDFLNRLQKNEITEEIKDKSQNALGSHSYILFHII